MKEYPFKTVYTQVMDLYGEEMNPDAFESIAMIGWEKIKNRRTKMYRFIESPYWDETVDAYVLELPCNFDTLESVHRLSESIVKTSPTELYPDTRSNFIESYIEGRKNNKTVQYTKGELINYEYACGKLYFSENFGQVQVSYKGLFLDDEGLPYLTNKEIDAIASYCAFVIFRKRFLATSDQGAMAKSQMLEAEWKRLCDAARVSSHITQNQMDEILDVKSSWDRKAYNKSYKPTR